MREKIKVGFCVSYDWELLKKSLPLVYNEADLICLSIDKNRKSWSGLSYEIDESAFSNFVRQLDVDKKIEVYEDDFSIRNLSSIENDNRQRTLMAEKMGKGGWHIQVDSDEYFLNFKQFVDYLLAFTPTPSKSKKAVNICCSSISLIKKTSSGYLVVDNTTAEQETMPFATNYPEYLSARRNSHFNHISPFFVIHETWARDEKQLRRKLDSWGHDNDFVNKESYFNLWQVLDEYNFQFIRSFHPLKPSVWHKLFFIRANDIDELIKKIPGTHLTKVDKIKWAMKNSRNVQRLVALINSSKKR
jgi:hypothetical protein